MVGPFLHRKQFPHLHSLQVLRIQAPVKYNNKTCSPQFLFKIYQGEEQFKEVLIMLKNSIWGLQRLFKLYTFCRDYHAQAILSVVDLDGPR